MPALATTTSTAPKPSTAASPIDVRGRATSPATARPSARHAPDRAAARREALGDGRADAARGAGHEHARVGADSTAGDSSGALGSGRMSTSRPPSPRRSTSRSSTGSQEAGLPITGANIARAMQVSAPTVHEMIGRLEGDGYVTRAERQVAQLHRIGPRARRPDRPPPPPDRALPDRRLRHPLGPGPRGGRAARALDVARGRGAHAARDRRRQDLPARAPDLRGRARARRSARRRRGGRQRPRPALRERGRGPAPLPQGHRPPPGPRGHARQLGDDERDRDRGRRRPRTRSPAAWPRPSRSWPTRRRRRAWRCPTSSCWAKSATGASASCPSAYDGNEGE